MEKKQESTDSQKQHYHAPDKLFCHHHFTKGKCTKKSECKFKHEIHLKKYSDPIPKGICPNGVKCPFSHQKIKCPIEQRDGSCQRVTVITGKKFKCEYKHKKPESQINQQKKEKKDKLLEKMEIEEEKRDDEDKQKAQEIQNKLENEEVEGMDIIEGQQEIQEIKEKKEKKDFYKNQLQKKFKVFKIPKLSQEGAQSTILGVLDQSGSMSSCFRYLARNWNKISAKYPNDTKTVIFHNVARQETKPLQEYPDFGGTHIESGFELLNQIIETQETNECLTIIFVSDGGDNNTNTIESRMEAYRYQVQKIQKNKKINFLCVGVGMGFPTFLSMKIRDLYHQGESTVPSVFLIEDPYSEQEFNTKMEEIQKYLHHNETVKSDVPVRIMPWEESTQETYDNTLVLVEEDIEQIVINGKTVVKELEKYTLQDIVNLGRVFLNDIQVRSLRKFQDASIIKKQSKQAHDLIVSLKEEHLSLKGKKLTFKEKVEIKYQQEQLNALIRSLKEFSETNVLDGLSEAEAAKRLAIGTTVGKYHQKAVDMAGLSVDDFVEARDEFANLLEKELEKKTFTEDNIGEQGQSFMSLQNQKELFLEEGFVESLRQIQNQYDLVEIFPLIGQSVNIRRTDGSMINPYLVSVQDIVRNHNVIDTCSLQQQQNKINVSVGNGEQENINAVLPLFGEKDKDIQFFLTSKLFSILMTFNVCQNADTCLDQAYFALLCNAVVNLLNQPDSEWKENMLKLVLETINIAYSKNKSFVEYATALQKEPEVAMITEITEKISVKLNKTHLQSLKCEDLSKAVTHLIMMVKFGFNGIVLSEEKIEEIFSAILCEAIGRFIPRDKKLDKTLDFTNKEEVENAIQYQKIVEKIVKSEQFIEETLLNNYYTEFDLLHAIEKAVYSLQVEVPNFEVRLDKSFLAQGKLNLRSLKHIHSYLLPGKKLPWNTLLQQAYFSYYFNTSTDRYLNKSKIFTYEKIISLLHDGKLKDLLVQSKKNAINEIASQIVPRYKQAVQKAHVFSLPLSNEEIQKVNGEVKFNQTSRLPKNVCISKECPHYLKANSQLSQHLQPVIKIPGLHKSCQLTAKQDIPDLDVFNMIINGANLKDGKNLTQEQNQALLNNQETWMLRIAALREFYAQQN